MTDHDSEDAERRKVIWGSQGSMGEDRSACPACGAQGTLVHRTKAATYFVCPACDRFWQQERGPG